MSKYTTLVVVTLVAAMVAGCSASSEQVSVAPPQVVQKPDVIVIYPLAIDPEDVTLNQGLFASSYRDLAGTDETAEQHDAAKNAADDVCLEIAAELTDKGHQAICQERGEQVAGNAILVDGAFTNLSEGDRLKRTVIGFGAGASVMDANVKVFHKTDAGVQKLLEFNTHADSGKQPGMAVMGPAGAAVGPAMLAVNAANMATKAHRSSFGRLQNRTAEAIVEQLTAYFDQHGWSA